MLVDQFLPPGTSPKEPFPKITVVRGDETEPLRLDFNLGAAMKGDTRSNYPLEPGDRVIVN